jgi:hypothetical protein
MQGRCYPRGLVTVSTQLDLEAAFSTSMLEPWYDQSTSTNFNLFQHISTRSFDWFLHISTLDFKTYLSNFNAFLGLNTLKRVKNYLCFNIFQTRDTKIFRFQHIIILRIFQTIILSTDFKKLFSTYFNVFQRIMSMLFQLNFGLNCVEICGNISTLFWRPVSLMLRQAAKRSG